MNKINILQDILSSRQHEPFKWGRNDCYLFVADVIKAITDKDIAFFERHRYRSLRQALEGIDKLGFRDYEDMFIQRCAFRGLKKRSYPLKAMPGDPVLFVQGRGITAGVISPCGSQIVVVSQTGLIYNRRNTIKHSWEL